MPFFDNLFTSFSNSVVDLHIARGLRRRTLSLLSIALFKHHSNEFSERYALPKAIVEPQKKPIFSLGNIRADDIFGPCTLSSVYTQYKKQIYAKISGDFPPYSTE